jgi:SAM-dependent methyltransferase
MSSYREESRARWAGSAAGWESGAAAFNRDAMPVSSAMIEALAPQPGHQLLELATGTGDTGLLAAELVQPGGVVTLSDFVPEMLSAAQRMAEAARVTNVRFRQIDADLPLDVEAASLDGVLCRWGYHLLADGEAALRETRRVLRPGGRVALSAWTRPEDNPWSALPIRALVARGLAEPPADPEAPGQFAWAREGAIAEHLDAAGFVEYEVEPVDLAVHVPDAESWWEVTTARAAQARDVAGRLDADTRAELVAELAAAARAWAGDGGLAIPGRSWVAWAEA